MIEITKVTAKKQDVRRENSVSPIPKSIISHSTNSLVDHVLHLQRTIGNRAVERLFKSGVIQAKLKIGKPNDMYEQETDRVAEKVMRMLELGCSECSEKEKEEEQIQTKPLPVNIAPLVQIQPEEEELQKQPDEEEEHFKAKEASGNILEVTDLLESRINSIKRVGSPIPKDVRFYFEPRFGVDFSNVRVHTDGCAAVSARTVNAQAYTLGNDIVFRSGRYAPETDQGRRLLAHELTHVVQQRGGIVLRCQYDSKTKTYRVQKRNTLSSIARNLGIKRKDLVTANPDVDPSKLQIGQVLAIPATPVKAKKGKKKEERCDIVVPSDAKAQVLAGALYAEADPTRESDDERLAIGWAFLNSVNHTVELCAGTICSDLKKHQRKFICKLDTKDLGNNLIAAIKIGSTTFGNKRWNMVMTGTKMRSSKDLCRLNILEKATLKKAIDSSEKILKGEGKKADLMRFNKAADAPPGPRWEKAETIGVHTFYKFKAGLECGIWK